MITKRNHARALAAFTGAALLLAALPAPAITRYVSLSGGHTAPYTNWVDAATNIQEAVNACSAGDLVLVAAGTYNTGGAATPGYAMMNRVVATNAITLQSVDGPDVTFIEGAGPRGSNAVRCVYVAGRARVAGFTLVGGKTTLAGTFPYERNGGAAYCTGWGSISNCVLTQSEGDEGGGLYITPSGNAWDCTMISNRASAGGGGVRFSDAGTSTVSRCRIIQNWSRGAAGVHIYHSGRLQNCLVADNLATQAAGAIFVDWGSQGAYIDNCTIAGNTGPGSAVSYVINGATVRNSIIFGNSAGNWSGGSYSYCDTTPLPGGAGNITNNPQFADSEYRLSASSPCVDAGTNAYAPGSVDLEGNPRIVGAAVDMGAYEYGSAGSYVTQPADPSGPAAGMVDVPLEYFTGGSTCSDAHPVEYRLDWGDGAYSGWSSATNAGHAWTNTGVFSVRAQARCSVSTDVVSAWSGALSVTITSAPPVASIRYVSLAGSHTAPYTNWATAATNIQAAVGICVPGDTVMVATGTYDTGGAATPGYALMNRFVATNAIAIQSVEGPAGTIVVGVSGSTNAVRCAYLSGGARLTGFTLRGGKTSRSGHFPEEQNGGAVYCTGNASVSNCVMKHSEAVEGGGLYIVYHGHAYDCLIVSNSASAGGGGLRFSDAGTSTVQRSRIVRNWSGSGGGVHIYHTGRLYNCLIADNIATQEGGGIFVDWGNYYSTAVTIIANCTIAGNTGPNGGGLGYVITGAQVYNSIIYGNTSPNYLSGTYNFCDTTPLPGGAGNISTDPLFSDADYHLSSASPCIDAGTNAWARGPGDLDGNGRIVGGSVDMGAYEYAGGGGQTVTAPQQPSGPSTGLVSEALSYETGGATCSGGGSAEYRFDWGDGAVGGWSSATNGGHAWGTSGVFAVRAQARCATNPSAVSTWSSSKNVSIVTPPPAAMTHYACSTGLAVVPYTNWATAAHKIQDAIDVSGDGDTVLVAPERFQENINFHGKKIEVGSLYMISGDRDYIGQTIIDGGGTGRVVLFNSGEDALARLSGFTLTNGYGQGTGYPEAYGGGVACFSASPRLDGLIVTGNRADQEGAGIYLSFSESEVRDVVVKGNSGYSCTGIRVSYGRPTLVNVVVEGNSAPGGAAGLLFYHSDVVVKNLVVKNNTTQGKAGGMLFDASSPVLENVTVVGNSAPAGKGGGLNVSYSSHPRLVNCVVWGNTAEQIVFDTQWWGMALTVEYSDVEGGSAGILTYGKGPLNWLAGNTSADPEFVGGGDCRLTVGSPCVDTGTNRSWMATETDPDGNARIVNTTVDMGAYEYSGSSGETVSVPQAPSGPAGALVTAAIEYFADGSSNSAGHAVDYRFDWEDGALSPWSSATNAWHAWATTGVFLVRAQARCAIDTDVMSAWSEALSVTVTSAPVSSLIHYACSTGLAVSPYTNWATAAHKIQDAIDVSADGDTVLAAAERFQENINFHGKKIEVGSLYMISGDRDYIGQTVIDGGGTGRVVLFNSGEDALARLSGFTLTNGYGQGTGYPEAYGGGVACFTASPRLDGLIVTGNRADQEGAGIYLSFSESEVRDVVVKGNSGYSCTGIRVSYGRPTLVNVVVEGNSAPGGAGGLLFYHSDVVVKNLVVKNNTTQGKAGGMMFDASSPVLENVTVVGNSAPAGKGGGLNVSYSSHPRLVNCVVWGNTAEQIVFDTQWWGMALTVEYSDVEGGSAGILTYGKGPLNWLAGNTSADPEFVGGGDCWLTVGSPCVDTGTNRSWMATETDVDLNPRIVNGTVDMGAYEFVSNDVPPAAGTITCSLNPEEVRSLGARWRLTTGPETNWLENGAVVHLATGTYEVVFRDLASWTTPAGVSVLLGPGSDVALYAWYVVQQADTEPPVIVHIVPPDGHVSNGNQIPMTIQVTDNVGVASVTVNGEPAEHSGGDVWHYTAHGVRGSYNTFVVVACDLAGNTATQVVNYGQGVNIHVAAMWDGYWRVRNPLSASVDFTWEVYGSEESGSGTAVSNRDTYFSTTLGPKTVILRVDGVQVDAKASSPLPPPEAVTDVGSVDSDEDGDSNRGEEIAGTDPNDANSSLCVRSGRGEVMGGGAGKGMPRQTGSEDKYFALTWETGLDSMYSVESSTNLHSWTTVYGHENMPGTGELMGYTNEMTGIEKMFLRVRAEKLP